MWRVYQQGETRNDKRVRSAAILFNDLMQYSLTCVEMGADVKVRLLTFEYRGKAGAWIKGNLPVTLQ